MQAIMRVVDRAYRAFRTREDAGRALAAELSERRASDPFVLAVPRGGVPVASEVARELQAPLDVIILRKLPVPFEPEAGFGAVSLEGDVVLNKHLVKRLGISDVQVEEIVERVLEEVRRRNSAYRGDRPFPELHGRSVFLVDDGLASGFSMVSAVEMVRRHNPRRVTVAVPVAPLSSVDIVSKCADDVICLIGQRYLPFAVASFYGEFPEMSDAEVRRYLEGMEAAPRGREGPA